MIHHPIYVKSIRFLQTALRGASQHSFDERVGCALRLINAT